MKEKTQSFAEMKREDNGKSAVFFENEKIIGLRAMIHAERKKHVDVTTLSRKIHTIISRSVTTEKIFTVKIRFYAACFFLSLLYLT